METIMLKGAPVRDAVFAELQRKMSAAPRRPGLAVVLVGDDAASAVYVKHKEKGCEQVGFYHVTHRLPDNTPEGEVLGLIERLNGDREIDGILVQLPLPAHLDQERILNSVNPDKDVDGFHPANLGRLVGGVPGFIPCTPKGILRLLEHYGFEMSGQNVAVVGRSVIVGRPLSLLLSLKRKGGNATVTMCHSGTVNLPAITSRADVVIAAVGAPRLINREYVKEGAVVVDVGINRIADASRKSGTRLVGDVDTNDLMGHAAALTPVPGGVGPMTIAMLLENTWESMYQTER